MGEEVIDDLSNAQDIDSSEEEVIDDSVSEEESNEEESSEDGEEESNEEENEEESSDEKENVEFSRHSIKEITAKYPKFFKDFPALRHAFFHEKEYRQIFPTVDDAKEAVIALEEYQELQSNLSSGKLETIIESIGVDKVASRILPALKKVDNEAYLDVITPVLEGFVRGLYSAGIQNSNDNMKNAALQAARYYFGDDKIASGEKTTVTKREKEKDTELEKERESFRNERYTVFHNEVATHCGSQLNKMIETGLDPNNKMSKGMKSMVVDRIIKQVNTVMKADKFHVGQMNSLWKKADKDGFTSTAKTRIIQAYLERAKEVLPGIRSKIRLEVLGTRAKKEDRTEPKNNVSGRSNGNRKGEVDLDKVDWDRTSNLDFIKGNITYKK